MRAAASIFYRQAVILLYKTHTINMCMHMYCLGERLNGIHSSTWYIYRKENMVRIHTRIHTRYYGVYIFYILSVVYAATAVTVGK